MNLLFNPRRLSKDPGSQPKFLSNDGGPLPGGIKRQMSSDNHKPDELQDFVCKYKIKGGGVARAEAVRYIYMNVINKQK